MSGLVNRSLIAMARENVSTPFKIDYHIFILKNENTNIIVLASGWREKLRQENISLCSAQMEPTVKLRLFV